MNNGTPGLPMSLGKTLVVIPAYNEEDNIARVIQQIRKYVPYIDILVINDGSKDRTEQVVSDIGAEVINLPYNMGYGTALQTGFRYALRHGYGYAVQIDGDGQHDPKDMPTLLNVVLKNEADVAIGSRFLNVETYKAPRLRRIGMILFGYVASFIIGQKITDPTSGYQALNTNGIRFYASDYYPADFPDADVIIMLHRAGLSIKEIPVTMYLDVGNKSMHAGLKPIYYIFKMFLSIFLTLLRKHPFKKE